MLKTRINLNNSTNYTWQQLSHFLLIRSANRAILHPDGQFPTADGLSAGRPLPYLSVSKLDPTAA